MKTNGQRVRPATVLVCAVLVVGVFTAIWLVPKLLSFNPVAKPETAVAVSEPTQQQTSVPPKAILTPPAGKPPQEWGIEVKGLYPAVGGRVLDLRYKILDTGKAAGLPNVLSGIYLIDEATGTTIPMPNTPRTGSIPQNPQKLEAGRVYSLSFPNPDGRFKSGSKVTLVLGGLRAEHLAVQ
jgi:hypothetical protein